MAERPVITDGLASGGLSRALFLSYDTARYPFHVLAAEVLGTSALANLHDHVRAAKKVHTLRYEDNLEQRATLAAMPEDGPFYRLYRKFISQEVAPRFGGHIGFTAHPTFRVHMAGTGCVSKWHTDAEVTGEPMYIAVWLPFVDVAGTNTLWVESDYGLGDYGPVSVAHGEAFMFDGSRLKHGTVENETDVTRVSMDFRFLVRPRPGAPLADRGVFAGRPPGLDQSAAPAG